MLCLHLLNGYQLVSVFVKALAIVGLCCQLYVHILRT